MFASFKRAPRIHFAVRIAALGLVFGCRHSADEFIALQRDFADFQSWDHFEFDADEAGGHLDGPRTIYYNQRPKAHDTAFPVGTVLIKVVESAEDPVDWEIPAAVKRGGDFNADGAEGWEWFELTLSNGETPVIRWRGEAPPSGEGYGSLGGEDSEEASLGDCNTCHLAAWENDYVFSKPLHDFGK